MKRIQTIGLKVFSLFLTLSMLLSFATVGGFHAAAATVVPTTLVRQNVSTWKNYTYGSGTLYDTGCGMFAIVNAVGYLTGNTMSVTEVASWGHSIGGYNPGSSHDGTYRMTIYPRLQAKYGTRYGFTVDCGSTNEGYWAGSSSTTLKNHLKNGGVAIGHVPGHFIAVVGYNATSNKFHVYDSYPTTARGTGNGDAWVTQSQLATGKLKLDWFCLLTRTGTVINNQAAAKTYTVSFDSRGGSAVSQQKVEEGSYAKKPANPTRDGFEFLGWYDENGWLFAFETTGIWANRSLHAEWKAISWPQTTEYMPTQTNTVAETYRFEGESYVWPYYSPYTGDVTFYKGGADFGWPSALTTYNTSVDLSKYAYLNISVTSTAYFNADLLFRDANAVTHTVKLSQIINGNDDDFAPGQFVLCASVGMYLYSNGYTMPANSVVNIEAIRYYVVGGPDQYVTLNAVCFTPALEHINTMLPDTLAQTPVAGATGKYTYENGVLTMEGTGGYNVSFYPNVSFSPAEFPYWVVSVSAGTSFDLSMVVTTSNGDKRVSLASDYYLQLGYDTYPELGLGVGQYTESFDLLNMYKWNGILPADGISTIKQVTIELRGEGKAVVRANQMSTAPVVHYYTDTVSKSDSWAGKVAIDNETYVLNSETEVILSPNTGLSVGETKNGMNNASYIHFFDGNTEVTDSAVAKTGLIVKVMNGNTLLSEYTLAVRGDVDQNGNSNTSDIRVILKALASTNTFTVTQEAAADLNGDGSITTVDCRDLLGGLM